MGKFRGVVGYGYSRETVPGVYEDVAEEHMYRGDVLRDSRGLEANQTVNSDITVGNSISIVADEYARKNIFAIRYVMWRGTRWVVSSVEANHPRFTLRLGGVYNGPTPETPGTP